MLEIARIEEFDQLKVEVRLGSSSTRVIDLTNPTTLQARIDVTDEVEWDGDRPTFESLHEVATDLVRDIAEDQGVPR